MAEIAATPHRCTNCGSTNLLYGHEILDVGVGVLGCCGLSVFRYCGVAVLRPEKFGVLGCWGVSVFRCCCVSVLRCYGRKSLECWGVSAGKVWTHYKEYGNTLTPSLTRARRQGRISLVSYFHVTEKCFLLNRVNPSK